MTGFSNYSAGNVGGYLNQLVPPPPVTGLWLALFTAVGTDAGTGFTEVSGNGYTRVQVAGVLAAGGSWTTSSTTITLGSTAPAWLLALGTNGSGVRMWDTSFSPAKPIGTVSSITGTTVTLTSTATNASSGSTDNIAFSAFGDPTGTAPSSQTNSAAITEPAATGSGWGTVIAFGTYDASTSGDLQGWDFLGNFSWLPFEMPTASGTVTAKGNGLSSNDPVVFTAEYGGTLPSLSTGVMTGYTVSFAGSVATDTFVPNTTSGPTTPFVSTSSGSGMVRKIVQQSIPGGITANFAANALTVTLA